MTATASDGGHASRAHTADEIIEAWGPTREACLEEAVLALVDTVAVVDGVGWSWHHEVELEGSDEELLVALLEEVIYHLDADGAVPVRVRVRPHAGGVVVHLWLTDLHRVTPVGAAPKGVSYSQLACHEEDDGRWHCAATIDV
jgi:SHS2 domain-containing protein